MTLIKNDISRLGCLLFELRERNNLTQAELADKVGVTRQTIAKIENGHGESVSFGTWISIADVLCRRFNIEEIFFTPQDFATGEKINDNPLRGYTGWKRKGK